MPGAKLESARRWGMRSDRYAGSGEEGKVVGDDISWRAEPAMAARLVALLFGMGDPVPGRTLGDWLGIEEEEIRSLAQRVTKDLVSQGHPLRIREAKGGFQLVLADEFVLLVRPHLAERSERLSPALSETLAIVAYRQPIRASAIDALRGVRAERALALLEDRGLVRLRGQEGYVTTAAFLAAFGLQSLEELPPWPGEAAGGGTGGEVPFDHGSVRTSDPGTGSHREGGPGSTGRQGDPV